jgi:hypothetical protein
MTIDTKGVIRIRISKKNRKHNGQKDKQRSTKHTHKAKDRVARTPLKPGDELRVQLNAKLFLVASNKQLLP